MIKNRTAILVLLTGLNLLSFGDNKLAVMPVAAKQAHPVID